MIEIVNQKTKKECTCNFCHTNFYFTDEDLIDVNKNYCGFICPVCGNPIEIFKINESKFPESFYHFINGKQLSNEQIQKYVNRVRKELENSEEDFDYCLSGTGDTMVFGYKTLEDDVHSISIIVAQNYYECNIFLE